MPPQAAPDPTHWTRHLRVMLGSVLWLVAVSYLRFGLAGTLDLDAPPFNVGREVTTRLLMIPGVALLCLSYLRLWRGGVPATARRGLLKWSVALAVAAALALPLTSNDVFSNLAYGHMSHAGLDTSRLGPRALPPQDPFRALVTPRWLDSPCVYGPVSGAAFYLTTIGGSVWAALVAYKLLFLAVALATIFLCYRACAAVLPAGRSMPALVLFICNPLFLWEVAGQGHNDGLMILFTLLFVVALVRRQVWWAGLCLILGILGKSAVLPVLFFLTTYLMGRLRERYYWWFCGAAAAAFAALLWLYPKMDLPMGLSSAGAAVVATRLINSIPYLLFTFSLPMGEAVALTVYRVYWLASLVVVAAVAVRYGRKVTDPQALFEYSFRYLLLLALVFSPNLQPWYFTWALPFAIFTGSEPLERFLVLASLAFFMLYPALQSVPAGLLALACLVLLLTRYRTDLDLFVRLPGPGVAVNAPTG